MYGLSTFGCPSHAGSFKAVLETATRQGGILGTSSVGYELRNIYVLLRPRICDLPAVFAASSTEHGLCCPSISLITKQASNHVRCCAVKIIESVDAANRCHASISRTDSLFRERCQSKSRRLDQRHSFVICRAASKARNAIAEFGSFLM